MKKILLFIQLFAFFIAYGVPPSWNVNKDGIKMQLNFNSNTIGIEENNIINTDLKKKYQIGVFIIRENKEICLGYMSYDANSTTSLTIWGLPQKDIKNTLYLRLWDTVTNCEITNVKAVLTANNVELIYRPNDTLIMQKLVFTKSPDIFYACLLYTSPSPRD